MILCFLMIRRRRRRREARGRVVQVVGFGIESLVRWEMGVVRK